MLYHGRIPHHARQPILDQFKTDPRKHVLLMSYGTGSVGLNLQFANYVFLFDRWWNPAVEDQAINRAHRIGQKDPVFVTRFISQGTIEGRIAEVLEKKRQLFNELIEQNGALLFPGAVVALVGPLGAGKTFLARAIAEGLGIADSRVVTSPTFVLIQEYEARLPIYHFDVYRLKRQTEFFDLGAQEYLSGDG